MRREFEEQLKEMQLKLIKMGSVCEEAIDLCVKMLHGEAEEGGGKMVSRFEFETDGLEREIESICMKLLLLQQPVAKDLRAISAALRMISDLERIGDQADDIAELAPHIAKGSHSKLHIDAMAKMASNMVTGSIDAYVKQDLELARDIQKQDDIVDGLFDKVKSELMVLLEKKAVSAEEALDFIMAAKYFERIADHAVNVAEWVEYSITGSHKKYDIKEGL